LIGSPAMDCEVSSSSRQGQRGSGLSANSLDPKGICSKSEMPPKSSPEHPSPPVMKEPARSFNREAEDARIQSFLAGALPSTTRTWSPSDKPSGGLSMILS